MAQFMLVPLHARNLITSTLDLSGKLVKYADSPGPAPINSDLIKSGLKPRQW